MSIVKSTSTYDGNVPLELFAGMRGRGDGDGQSLLQHGQLVLIELRPNPHHGEISNVHQMVTHHHAPALIHADVLHHAFER
jgi:hypothetical protein